MLRQLIEAGVNVFRLNFSHGTHEEHCAVARTSEPPAASWDAQIGILQDLCGPKMRLGSIPGDVVDCALGEEFTPRLATHPCRP